MAPPDLGFLQKTLSTRVSNRKNSEQNTSQNMNNVDNDVRTFGQNKKRVCGQ
jgi:hypothetical protein